MGWSKMSTIGVSDGGQKIKGILIFFKFLQLRIPQNAIIESILFMYGPKKQHPIMSINTSSHAGL